MDVECYLMSSVMVWRADWISALIALEHCHTFADMLESAVIQVLIVVHNTIIGLHSYSQ